MSAPSVLFGRNVFWTGLDESGAAILAAFEQIGAVVRRYPLLTCRFSTDINPFQNLETGPDTWIVFSSARAVEAVSRLQLPEVKIAVVGTATEAKLRELGRFPDLIATTQTAAGLADALIHSSRAAGDVLFLRGDKAMPTIPERLRSEGYRVKEREVYRTTAVSKTEAQRVAIEIEETADAVLFGSPSGVRALAAALPLHTIAARKPGLVFAALGPTTAAALKTAGIERPTVADSPAPEAVVVAVERALLV